MQNCVFCLFSRVRARACPSASVVIQFYISPLHRAAFFHSLRHRGMIKNLYYFRMNVTSLPHTPCPPIAAPGRAWNHPPSAKGEGVQPRRPTRRTAAGRTSSGISRLLFPQKDYRRLPKDYLLFLLLSIYYINSSLVVCKNGHICIVSSADTENPRHGQQQP